MTGKSEHVFDPGEELARRLDAEDPLAPHRERFHLPLRENGEPQVYLCGNSLGLQPRTTAAAVEQELEDWRRLAVHAHFRGRTPWYDYHEVFREVGARLVGARPGEVVLMNGLTVNLHLMMVSFFRPAGNRTKILIESSAFPSDGYAVRSQLAFHGLDPSAELIIIEPRPGERCLRTEDITGLIEERGSEIALVLLGGVQFLTGQLFAMERITECGRRQGCVVGFDLAHAAGNAELALHDWNVDFAVWCGYKYLNGGPGAVAGCFVHERHAVAPELPRFAGWWGNAPEKRFQMQLVPEFIPQPGAAGWQLSNPPILAMAPLRSSLAIFDEVGMPALRRKSLRLTGYLEQHIDHIPGGRYETITPRDPEERGCQLSILVKDGDPDALLASLERHGIVADFRPPDVIRVAPVPLYNTFHDVWAFAQALRDADAAPEGGWS